MFEIYGSVLGIDAHIDRNNILVVDQCTSKTRIIEVLYSEVIVSCAAFFTGYFYLDGYRKMFFNEY